jgi:hypothetical protein
MCACGLSNIRIESIEDYMGDKGWRVACSTCAQVGPMRLSEDRAILDYFDGTMSSPGIIDGYATVLHSKKFGGNFK